MKNLAFTKTNFLIIALSFLVIVLGFCLMAGGESNESVFDESIFSTVRIKVAPVVCFLGFVAMIFGVMYHKKK